MPLVFVYAPKLQTQKKSKTDRELLWYDVVKQEMVKLRGSRLVFAYAYDESLGFNRMLPQAVNEEVITPVSEYKVSTIEDWFADEYVSSDIEQVETNNFEGWVEFNVPPTEMNEFKQELEYQGFDHEVY